MLLKIFVKVLKVALLCFVPLDSDQLQTAELSSVFCNDCGNLFHRCNVKHHLLELALQFLVLAILCVQVLAILCD